MKMSTYDSGRSVKHSKENALGDVEFELLFEGASKMDDYYGMQAQAAVLILGRLGLRRGELAHLKSNWVNVREKMMTIPLYEPCNGEKNGDGPCGYCKQLAKGKAERREDVTEKEIMDSQWEPKTDAAARDVYYGFDARVEMFLERFIENWDSWIWSAQSVNRRIEKAAENAHMQTDVTPHTLRATAATYHAARGLEMHALMQYFGWAQPSTAEVYLARNGRNTARQLDSIHSR